MINKSIKIGIVEDHRSLRELMVDELSSNDHEIFGFGNAEQLDRHALNHSLDILVLDLNLPDEDGLEIAKRYRKSHSNLFIIMLTVRSEALDRLKGLQSGADLYLPKPFSSDELLAAITNFKKRILNNINSENVAKLNVETLRLSCSHKNTLLNKSEANILHAMIQAEDQKLPYWQLFEILGLDFTASNKRKLSVYIFRLNQKLESIGLESPSIYSMWNEGYRLISNININ
jgi:DNA-binding response OmpR family regulator